MTIACCFDEANAMLWGVADGHELSGEGSSPNTCRSQEEERSCHGQPVTALLEK